MGKPAEKITLVVKLNSLFGFTALLKVRRSVACRSRNNQSLNYSGRLVAALACKKSYTISSAMVTRMIFRKNTSSQSLMNDRMTYHITFVCVAFFTLNRRKKKRENRSLL